MLGGFIAGFVLLGLDMPGYCMFF